VNSHDESDILTLNAPVAGCVVTLLAEPGRAFEGAQPLLLLESMKMEIPVEAPSAGEVVQWWVGIGDMVDAGEPLLRWRRTPQAAAQPTPLAPQPHPSQALRHSNSARPSLASPINPSNPEGPASTARQRLAERRHLLDDGARPDAMARRHASGLRSARENLADLLDANSFVEYGAHAIAAQRSRRPLPDLQSQTPADGLVCGTGAVGGRPVAALAYDYTVLAGTQGYWNHAKSDRLLEIVARHQLPVVWFVEGGGGRPGDVDAPVVAGLHCSTFARWAALAGLVPRLAIVAGRCFAGNAALAGASDLIIAVRGANLGLGGPAMIEGGGLGRVEADEIGPLSVMVPNGVVDIAVDSEAKAVTVARQLLSLLTTPMLKAPAEVASFSAGGDALKLRDALPARRNTVYEPRHIVQTVVDEGSWIELRQHFGSGVVTGLARLGGQAVAVVASDPRFLGGALDAAACDKLARFMQLADSFGLPLVSLLDTPGFMVGTAAEETAMVRHAGRVFVQAAALRVPVLSIVLRRAYGLGAMALAAGHFHAPLAMAAWPGAECGAMGLEGAVKLGFRRELEAAAPMDRGALFQQLLDQALESGAALNMASHLEIDTVIDPSETRAWLLSHLSVARNRPLPPRRTLLDTW
jgi:acetyl-CoA carboxylase carboxyltransferase component